MPAASTRPWLVLVLTLTSLLSLGLWPGTAGAQLFVLKPGLEARVSQLLQVDQAQTGCVLERVAIDRAQLRAHYRCLPEGAALVEVLFSPKEPGLLDRSQRATVDVSFPAGTPRQAVLETALRNLARREDASALWTYIPPASAAPSARGNQAQARRPLPPGMMEGLPGSLGAAWAVTVGMVVGPLLLGAVLGTLLRRGTRRGRAGAAGIVLGVLLLAAGLWRWLQLRWTMLNPYDLVWVLGLATLSVGLARWRPFRDTPKSVWLGSALFVALALGGIERKLRRQGLKGPWSWPWHQPSLVYSECARAPACFVAYPELDDGEYYKSVDEHAAPGLQRVLHIGDSMVQGGDVSKAQRFVTLLTGLEPGHVHYNLGMSSTSTDLQYFTLQHGLERFKPQTVVLHVYPANDLFEMDQNYACCGDGPLLRFEGTDVLPRCPKPDLQLRLSTAFERGPSPFPVLMLRRDSELVRRLDYAFERMIHHSSPEEAAALALPHFAQVLAVLQRRAREAQVRLLLAFPPDASLSPKHPSPEPEARRQGMLRAAQATGLPVYDAQQSFVEASQREPAASWFISATNPHMAPAGHVLYAAELDKFLRAAGAF